MQEHLSLTPSAVPAPPPRTRGRVCKSVIPEVIFGIGTLAEVGGAVRRVGGHRPLLVSDPGVVAAGWVDRALPHLGDVRVESHLWHDLTPNPKDFEVEPVGDAYIMTKPRPVGEDDVRRICDAAY